MFRPIKDFSLGLDGRKDPFEPNDDLADAVFLFIYMTGRGEYSYLFPDMSENDIVAEADRTIPMGYTQLLILEWIKSVRPRYQRNKGKKVRPSQRRAAEELSQGGAQEGQAFVLLTENGLCLGWSPKLQLAESAALAIAEERKSRIVIALLRANITWH